jgi:hypothetical protein
MILMATRSMLLPPRLAACPASPVCVDLRLLIFSSSKYEIEALLSTKIYTDDYGKYYLYVTVARRSFYVSMRAKMRSLGPATARPSNLYPLTLASILVTRP